MYTKWRNNNASPTSKNYGLFVHHVINDVHEDGKVLIHNTYIDIVNQRELQELDANVDWETLMDNRWCIVVNNGQILVSNVNLVTKH